MFQLLPVASLIWIPNTKAMHIFCLDTNILGMLCNPRPDRHPELLAWFDSVLRKPDSAELCIPEIADYELRRKLLHLALREGKTMTRSLERLERLSQSLTYLPINSQVLKQAAQLWAKARLEGIPTTPPEALDGDVILAAQALEKGAAVITTNRKHLERFVPVADWQEILL